MIAAPEADGQRVRFVVGGANLPCFWSSIREATMADEREPDGLVVCGYVAGVAKVGSGRVLEMGELKMKRGRHMKLKKQGRGDVAGRVKSRPVSLSVLLANAWWHYR